MLLVMFCLTSNMNHFVNLFKMKFNVTTPVYKMANKNFRRWKLHYIGDKSFGLCGKNIS